MQEKRIWTKRRSSVYVKNLAKPKEIAMKNKSGNPDSNNSSMAHPEERLDNETLQATTRSGHKAGDNRKRKPN